MRFLKRILMIFLHIRIRQAQERCSSKCMIRFFDDPFATIASMTVVVWFISRREPVANMHVPQLSRTSYKLTGEYVHSG